MKLSEIIKKINSTVLEMLLGILFLGLICQIVGTIFVSEMLRYAKSLWFGILIAMVNTVHMYRTLDRALDYGEKEATKIMVRGYVFRYVFLTVVLFIILLTDALNPLVVFMGCMTLKVTAYLQPITHKVCNKLLYKTK